MNILAMQLDSKLGAMEENVERALELIEIASDSPNPPDLVVLPPHYVSGYPLRGLEYSDTFRERLQGALQALAQGTPVPVLILSYTERAGGSPFEDMEGIGDDWAADPGFSEACLDIAVLLLADGGIQILEGSDGDYSVLFSAVVSGVGIDVVLDDIADVNGNELSGSVIVNLVDDTYDILRPEIISGEFLAQCKGVARDCGKWVVRVGCVGSQDTMVFPGGSVIVTPEGDLAGDAVLFDEALLSVEFDPEGGMEAGWETSLEEIDDRDFGFSVRMDDGGIDDEAADWNAIVCAVADYVSKNGFTDVVVGLSGGIDSSMVATIATDALGAEHVHGVLMPSMYSSDHSVNDATDLAERLGIQTFTIPIIGPFEAFEEALSEACGGAVEGVTRENLQARIRTIYLMAMSNNYGWVLLNTGNKSEAAMGYSTLYGDTAGAYAPLGNIYKTRLYELAEWRNEQSEVIPHNVLVKAPSAELHPGQKDQDSLPPYEILDGICTLYLEYGYDPAAIVEEGFEPDVVDKVLGLIAGNEYKRANEPIGPVIDGISLDEDREWPITNAFRDRVAR